MNRNQYQAMLILAVGVGLISGVALDRLSTADQPIRAQPTQQPAEVIRAEKVELVARDGTRRAALGLGSKGEPALELYDPGGSLRAELSLRPDGGPNLLLWDGQTENPRAGVALLPDGSPSLELADQGGNLRVVFGLGTEGQPVLGLFDQEGNLYAAPASETCDEVLEQRLHQALGTDTSRSASAKNVQIEESPYGNQ